MAICTDFKAVAETNQGTVLSETKEVEKECGAVSQMGPKRLETVHGVDVEARRKTDGRNNDSD
jgi:hypothetical protein